ncbi:hypothetical protein Leryth_008910 [Lithospermum erythrorhizon]|nr:hypothetical protein Leryth_008910 [Lithospermum erythrorhizon]
MKYSDGETQGPGGSMTECETKTPNERRLTSKDDLCESLNRVLIISSFSSRNVAYAFRLMTMVMNYASFLCGHHFHSTCVDKWLFIDAYSPLCKYDIMQSFNSSRLLTLWEDFVLPLWNKATHCPLM